MSNQESPSVNFITPTTEELAAAHPTTLNSWLTDHADSDESGTTGGPEPVSSAAIVIDLARKDSIIERITTVLNNPRFWEVESRVDRLEDAAVIPMFDDKSLQGFATSAKKELIQVAVEHSVKHQTVAVLPTEDQIRTLALKKHQEKQDKDARKQK
jgi:hypothetical protein